MKRIVSNRRLTLEEAEKARVVRSQLLKEFPPTPSLEKPEPKDNSKS